MNDILASCISHRLWEKVEDLFLKHYCPNFWSDADVIMPYGRVMVIDPADMPSMFWTVDLNAVDFGDIVEDAKRLENTYKRPVGFAISSSWSGDLEKFRNFLAAKNFEMIGSTCWLVRSLEVHYPRVSLEETFSIEKTEDLDLVANQMAEGFGRETGLLFLHGARWHGPDHHRAYFIARDVVSGMPIGSAAVYVRNGLAYMSGLSVSKDFRKRGIASALVNTRLDFARKAGATMAVTCVWHANVASLATQKHAGYEILENVEYWMPLSGI
jgi:ribosomal protein S18 acetylase RimI-like enzyme